MQLYVASDHRGFTVKQRLLTFLAEYQNQHPEMNIEVKDLGPLTIQPGDDFNDSAITVSRAVRENPTARGFLICGSAHGISIQANRFRGIRAICGYTESLARIGRKHNDANVLCLSSDFMDDQNIDQAIDMFLRGNFLPEERYIRRNRRLDEETIY